MTKQTEADGNPYVRVQRADGILDLCLARPEKHNALVAPLAAELSTQLRAAQTDPEVRVILLHAEGKNFCAGGDLDAFSKLYGKPPTDQHEEGRQLSELFKLGRTLEKPVIGAIQGNALGGGMGLTALCHVAVAGKSSRFGATEIRLGLFPMVIGPLLIDALGYRQALALALTGRVITADEGLAMGLLHQVVEDDDILPCARRIAAEMAGRSPVALRVGMEAYVTAHEIQGPEAFAVMRAFSNVVFLSADLQEGTKAFLEKRKPRWSGR